MKIALSLLAFALTLALTSPSVAEEKAHESTGDHHAPEETNKDQKPSQNEKHEAAADHGGGHAVGVAVELQQAVFNP